MLLASAQSVSVDRLRLLEAGWPRQDCIASAFKFPRSCLHTCSQFLPSTCPISISRMTLVALDLSQSGWRDSLLRRRVTLTCCASRPTCSNGSPNISPPAEAKKICSTFLWSQATVKIELVGSSLLASCSSQQVTSMVLTCRDSLNKICCSILLTILTRGSVHHNKVHSSCTHLLDVERGNTQCPSLLCPDAVSRRQIRIHAHLFQCHQATQAV